MEGEKNRRRKKKTVNISLPQPSRSTSLEHFLGNEAAIYNTLKNRTSRAG